MLTPPHSLHLLRCRLCGQRPPPAHSLHLLLTRLCGQMLPPPHSLQMLLFRLCGHRPRLPPCLGPDRCAPSLASVIQRAEDQLQRAASSRAQAFWVTDLQRSSHDVNQTTAPDTSARWHVLPLRANEVPNMWVDSVWFDAPIALADQPAALYVRIAHDANEGVGALPLTLQIDGVTEAIGSFNVVPGLPTDTVLRFTHGAPGGTTASIALRRSSTRPLPQLRHCFRLHGLQACPRPRTSSASTFSSPMASSVPR